MNEAEFKEHLKALAHGHHHPEEHDWESANAPKRAPDRKQGTVRKRVKKKPGRG